jgi:hypothetical protein
VVVAPANHRRPLSIDGFAIRSPPALATGGPRFLFVPDDRLDEQPEVQIREPEEDDRDPAAN